MHNAEDQKTRWTIVAKLNPFRKAGDAKAVDAGQTITAAGERMSEAFDEALTRMVLARSLSAHHNEKAPAA